MKTNPKSHSMDLSSEKGMTTREIQSEIVSQDPPHYYEVRDEKGNRYRHCGSMKDVMKIWKENMSFSYEKKYLGETPQTVDVPYVSVPPDPELPPQQILPESNWRKIEL